MQNHICLNLLNVDYFDCFFPVRRLMGINRFDYEESFTYITYI